MEAQKNLKHMIQNMTTITEALGMVNPMNKIYHLTRRLESMSMFFTIFTIAIFKDLQYSLSLNSMMRKNDSGANDIDGPPLIVGILTVFK